MVRRFAFRLEPVLVHRRRREEETVRVLARTKGEVLTAEEALRRHAARRDRSSVEARELFARGAFDADEAALHWRFGECLVREGARLVEREREARERLEEAREAALAASRARRLLEMLKERCLREHRAQVAREEQKFLDEIAGIARQRRLRNRTDSPVGSGGMGGR